jgi:hypothetical protein
VREVDRLRTPTRRAPAPTRPRRPAEIRAARRRARDHSLRRDAVVLLVVLVGLAVTWAVREVPDERFPVVAERTTQLDATYAAVRAGELQVGTEPTELAPGVSGARIERPTGDRWVLTGVAGDDCYAVWWDEAGLRRTRTVPSTQPCAAASWLTSTHPTAYDRLGRGGPEGEATDVWEGLRPDPVRFRLWFLPAIIVGGGLGLAALVRMSIALLTGDDPRNVRR